MKEVEKVPWSDKKKKKKTKGRVRARKNHPKLPKPPNQASPLQQDPPRAPPESSQAQLRLRAEQWDKRQVGDTQHEISCSRPKLLHRNSQTNWKINWQIGVFLQRNKKRTLHIEEVYEELCIQRHRDELTFSLTGDKDYEWKFLLGCSVKLE